MTPPTRALPLSEVYANPLQPRKIFAMAALEDLAASIRVQGLLQPITVVKRPSVHGTWLVVMGERRLRASRIADTKTIPAIVRDLSDEKVAELALLENLQREDLNITEEARAYQVFIDKGHTVETLAALLGFTQPWRIKDRLALLKLAGPLLEGLEKGAVTPTQAFEMSRLSAEGQFILWRHIQDGRCPNPQALKKVASAILDQENQIELFKPQATLTDEEKAAVSKIARFMERAGRLASLVTPAEIALMNDVAKSDARVWADKLGLLEGLCRDLRNAMLANAAKQDLMRVRQETK
ncbi:ParB/RepB/Spo0J family partition protein [Nevskia soli]|uniref:ParB/RepB/Spo0J family partition protein n=1 Tax=Nevskia soli TaxID=418856 RepID=UPI0015D82190|nr:ParB/RepB/Spo0J family partition protein [Nevskia soli]